MKHSDRILCFSGAAVLLLTLIPLLTLCFFSHPYYDDFSFSSVTHDVWTNTHSVSAVIDAAFENAQTIRNNWQGTYTGTILTNLQPGLFKESLYGFGPLFLFLCFTGCFFLLFYQLAVKMYLSKMRSCGLAFWLISLILQWLPSVAEGFYWFNGGIGNTFVYSILALTAVLCIQLCESQSRLWRGFLRVFLVVCCVILGGGSYTGGILSLLLLMSATVFLIVKKNPRAFSFLLLFLIFCVCFAYSILAPGNRIRAGMIGTNADAVQSILKAVYYGTALIANYVRLPLLAVLLAFLPSMLRSVRKSKLKFNHPVMVTAFIWLLFCAQLTPTLYSGVFLGGDRTINTYYISFYVFFLLWIYYLIGCCEKKYKLSALTEIYEKKWRNRILCASLAMLLLGTVGTLPYGEKLYGIQNMNGIQAAVSLANGEVAAYHEEMETREKLLNDVDVSVPVLKSLSVSPKCFMPDLLYTDFRSAKESLCLYYHKDSIETEAEPQ